MAFKNDIVYAGTADRFNDPYDTLVRYNLKALEEGVNRVMSMESLEECTIGDRHQLYHFSIWASSVKHFQYDKKESSNHW